MDRHTLDRTRKRMGAILDTVDYDFSRFTMEGFRKYLEACTGYSIQFVPWAMRSAVSGSWIVSSDGRGFIFFDANTPTIHQSHIQLHEMSHVICGHPPANAGDLLEGGVDSETLESFLLRTAHSQQVDLEAEVMASLIQERVLRYGRLQELLTVVSSNQDVADFVRVAGIAG